MTLTINILYRHLIIFIVSPKYSISKKYKNISLILNKNMLQLCAVGEEYED